jgi:hypothetical protein
MLENAKIQIGELEELVSYHKEAELNFEATISNLEVKLKCPKMPKN